MNTEFDVFSYNQWTVKVNLYLFPSGSSSRASFMEGQDMHLYHLHLKPYLTRLKMLEQNSKQGKIDSLEATHCLVHITWYQHIFSKNVGRFSDEWTFYDLAVVMFPLHSLSDNEIFLASLKCC